MNVGYWLIAIYEKRYKYPELIAVFLSNGKKCFGRVKKITRRELHLQDIYYLTSDPLNIGKVLVKLGDEMHGPEDLMIINKDHIIFFEKLKAEGKIAQAIVMHHQIMSEKAMPRKAKT